ncbi:hypothetical protein CBL_00538 [Carabus blaptoides fortunei]
MKCGVTEAEIVGTVEQKNSSKFLRCNGKTKAWFTSRLNPLFGLQSYLASHSNITPSRRLRLNRKSQLKRAFCTGHTLKFDTAIYIKERFERILDYIAYRPAILLYCFAL